MRKKNKKFNKIYEGNENNYKIDNLKLNTKYEFRICSIYNDIEGSWTDIHKIKIDFDSIILKDVEKKREMYQKMLEWSGYKGMNLIYRGTKDGMTSNVFHNKCDNQGPTIVLYKSEKSIFGGFCSISWVSDASYHKSPDSFIFTLINVHNTEPTKFPLKDNNDSDAIYGNSNYGPTFGSGHDISLDISDFLNNKIYTNFPYSYNDVLGKGRTIFDGNLNNKGGRFYIKEIEVFKLFK